MFRKQLEEADAIAVNKTDLLSVAEQSELVEMVRSSFPGKPVFVMSAATGEGVDAWLRHVMDGASSGNHIVPVDYKTYADGEAVLGWLNATVALQSPTPINAKAFCLRLLTEIKSRAGRHQAQIAHAKLLLAADGCMLVANLTDSQSTPAVRGDEQAVTSARLTINARVEISPKLLRQIVEESLAAATAGQIQARIDSLESFSPSPPKPVYRYDTVVTAKT